MSEVGKMNSRERGRRAATKVDMLPEIAAEPLEFLARSWSASALHVSKAIAPPTPPPCKTSISISNSTNNNNNTSTSTTTTTSSSSMASVLENEESASVLAGNPQLSFSFASSATSQLVLERIMSQSEISPLTSGRLSHSSEPLNGCLTEDADGTLPVSPYHEFDDVVKYLRSNNTLQPLFTGGRNGNIGGGSCGGGGVSTPTGKTVGRWLKERREKKKEEARTHNAQLHGAVSVASVAAAVAAIAAATATASAAGEDDQMAKTDTAVASAATLVAAQCVEAAEAMGADRDHLISAIGSAVNVRSHGHITTLTAAAATALRGVATLKARALKEVWNIAAAVPVEKGIATGMSGTDVNKDNSNGNYSEGLALEENFLDACNQELLARGTELLKRTRKGDLHWKIVYVYINRTGQVILKMKSKHVAATMTKKKKNEVLEVCREVASWPGRHLFEDGDQRQYFGLKTATRGVIEFECKNQREYQIWTRGVCRLLSIAAERKNKKKKKQRDN